MVDGVVGENIQLAQSHVGLEIKQGIVFVMILLHLPGERHAVDLQNKKGNVIPSLVLVCATLINELGNKEIEHNNSLIIIKSFY